MSTQKEHHCEQQRWTRGRHHRGRWRGIGRAEALLFAQEGARVVVNDVSADGAHAVVEQIIGDAGGEAQANTDDISDWDGAGRLVGPGDRRLRRAWTRLVNNAGILRDKMFVNMSVDDWDAVMKVHLRGSFCPTKHAVAYWREQSKAGDQRVARIVNTSSPSGIYGNVGQANYGAAKAGPRRLHADPRRGAVALRRAVQRDRAERADRA